MSLINREAARISPSKIRLAGFIVAKNNRIGKKKQEINGYEHLENLPSRRVSIECPGPEV
jgi:hypothetical protein